MSETISVDWKQEQLFASFVTIFGTFARMYSKGTNERKAITMTVKIVKTQLNY